MPLYGGYVVAHYVGRFGDSSLGTVYLALVGRRVLYMEELCVPCAMYPPMVCVAPATNVCLFSVSVLPLSLPFIV